MNDSTTNRQTERKKEGQKEGRKEGEKETNKDRYMERWDRLSRWDRVDSDCTGVINQTYLITSVGMQLGWLDGWLVGRGWVGWLIRQNDL